MSYRTEHPKPQFMRDHWECLNGTWDFEYDPGQSGEARGMHLPGTAYSMKIEVPFCPESKLSGIRNVDYMYSVWYRRSFDISAEQLKERVLLHFGAVDYLATVYVNGGPVGTHRGGYTSFVFDITDFLNEGTNVIALNAQDNARDHLIPCGKQSYEYASGGCLYTRTTGIWQTVWLEFVPRIRIESITYRTEPDSGTVTLEANVIGRAQLRAEIFYKGRPMGEDCVVPSGDTATLAVKLKETHLWEIGHGRLYDVAISYGEDVVHSYFGLRSVRMDGYRFLLNGKPVFQRLVLDQGYYPDGIYTAPSDEALLADIDRGIAVGFNGARLHQKVFEERYLYYCDLRGYMVWGEYPSWGVNPSRPELIYRILPEWMEVVQRDRNHPSIITWCPFNETWDICGCKQFDELPMLVYLTTKALDPTRPCVDSSGCFHISTDIFDVHNYEQDPVALAAAYDSLVTDGTITDRYAERQPYPKGMPVHVSEYGGIGWAMDGDAWGYGNGPQTKEEFYTRLKGLTDALLRNPCLCGFCYTQLTDVEQEQNGLYTYDRRLKFDAEKLRGIFTAAAAIEE